MLQDFFRLFGASGKYLPALAVVGILLTWHIARNDPWRISKSALLGMTIESALLGFPVMVLSLLAAHHLPLAASRTADSRSLLVLSLGAGIYEELVFRLIAFTLLNVIIVDVMKLTGRTAGLLIVFVPAVLSSPPTITWATTPSLGRVLSFAPWREFILGFCFFSVALA